MNIKILSLILFYLVLFFNLCSPTHAEVETSKATSKYILLGPNSYYLFRDYNVPLKEILNQKRSKEFRKDNNDYPNFGIKNQELWIKVDLDLSQSVNPIIEAATPWYLRFVFISITMETKFPIFNLKWIF